MERAFILAIDQGTTGTRAVLYDARGRTAGRAYREFRQYFPRPGRVEHDPTEIWETTMAVVKGALARAGAASGRLAAIGLTNQRETVVLWDRKTGRPAGPALVWQDRRGAELCAKLKRRGLEPMIRRKTGLVLDPYFSASKLSWLFRERGELLRRARSGDLLFGTIDAWLLWKLTGGKVHATDLSNASRTLLFDIRRALWDEELLELFGVPAAALPRALPSGGRFGVSAAQGALSAGIPVTAVMGDQQAALYGQGCHGPGGVKNTYGTGCFLMANLGPRRRPAPAGLLETLACDERGRKSYALEGSIFSAGAAVQWLRDGLGLIGSAGESEALARKARDSGGVSVIPAFTGLGSPHWRPELRGAVFGLTRGTRREHLVRATLESIAQQTADAVERLSSSGARLRELKADGGATANRFLMQFQADLLGLPVVVCAHAESTAWGAAKLAGRMAGLWDFGPGLEARLKPLVYAPKMSRRRARELREQWKEALGVLLA